MYLTKKPYSKICKIHKLSPEEDANSNIFKEILFKKTLINALNIVIDTIFAQEQIVYRTTLSSRFLDMIERAAADFTTTQKCEAETENDNVPYYYAVVDAKSFGKYLIPTYKPVYKPVPDTDQSDDDGVQPSPMGPTMK